MEEGREAGKLVSLGEIEKVIKAFAKDKSSVLDGWSVELFTDFFDIMGGDLLRMIEESRTECWVLGGLKSTFLILIPKSNKPTSFNEYRPIALCNLAYKIITKIIPNRIKPNLSKMMKREEFDFLANMQILDAVGISQEVLHSVKIKK